MSALLAVVAGVLLLQDAGLDGLSPEEQLVQQPLKLELPASKEGTWSGFFVDHQPAAEALAEVPRGALELATTAQGQYDRGDYPGAFRSSEAALLVAPDFPPSLLLLGTTAFRLRRHGDAKAALERFLEVAPGELWRTQVLGHALYSLGEYPAAVTHYRRVLGAFPTSSEARRGLALALYREGEDREALSELEALVKDAPDSASAWAWLAQVRFDLDDLEAALEAAQRSIELDGFDPRAAYVASRALFDLGREAEAEAMEQRWSELTAARSEIDALRNRLLFEPGNIGLALALAREYANLGDVAGLEAQLARLLSWPASDAELLERGLRAHELLLGAGGRPQARKLLEKLAELYPREPRVAALLLATAPEESPRAK